MLVLGEPLGRYGGLGDALAVAGIATAAMRVTTGPPDGGWRQATGPRWATVSGGRAPLPWQPRAGRARPRRRAWPGLMLALASAATYGTGAFWLGMYAAAAGWLVSALMVYVISVTVLLAM